MNGREGPIPDMTRVSVEKKREKKERFECGMGCVVMRGTQNKLEKESRNERPKRGMETAAEKMDPLTLR